MTGRQSEHPEAAEELDAAARWYEAQEPGLGLTLVDQAARARRNIAVWPDAGRPCPRSAEGTLVRSTGIEGFPYRIVYTVEADGVLILAYAHERRKPGFWADRHDS